MTGYTITQIEDAIITTLKNDSNISSYIKTVDRMPLEDRSLAKKLIFNYPALLVIYGGGGDSADLYPEIIHIGKFAVWCVDKSVRKISGASEGVYTMLNDVLNALHGNFLGLDIEDCISVGVSFVDADEKITIYSRDFEIKWRYK